VQGTETLAAYILGRDRMVKHSCSSFQRWGRGWCRGWCGLWTLVSFPAPTSYTRMNHVIHERVRGLNEPCSFSGSESG